MYRNSTDKRVIHSAEALYNAVLELMDEKEFDKIGIKEVCEKAGIGRATFYRNFDYVDDILRFATNQHFEQLHEATCNMAPDIDTSAEIKIFFDFWVARGDLLNALYKAHRWQIFGEMFFAASQIKMQEKLERFGLNEVQYVYFHNSIQLSISTTLHTWLERNRKESSDDLVKLFELPFEMFAKMKS
ncbi:regulatory TetR family protein [Reinekea marinisedimentorum]|uniref:Regulatory TetR family protein n=2 Tax=Reinekea marinisedimentorum TaxID=230495 RepID=A0A4V2UIW1_9GAMM|nr:TetR/AcrR family transcriptional regulator [Reinekea marinisedimentorum]TCS37690.1 regulatory TetR family protein [Reinekea marinisedimentorum]